MKLFLIAAVTGSTFKRMQFFLYSCIFLHLLLTSVGKSLASFQVKRELTSYVVWRAILCYWCIFFLWGPLLFLPYLLWPGFQMTVVWTDLGARNLLCAAWSKATVLYAVSEHLLLLENQLWGRPLLSPNGCATVQHVIWTDYFSVFLLFFKVVVVALKIFWHLLKCDLKPFVSVLNCDPQQKLGSRQWHNLQTPLVKCTHSWADMLLLKTP